MKLLKPLGYGLLALILLPWLTSSFKAASDTSSTRRTESNASAASVSASSASDAALKRDSENLPAFSIASGPHNWDYESKVDEMRGIRTFLARVESADAVAPGSYYSANTRLELSLRKKGKQTNAWIRVEPRGQLWCDYETCRIQVRFDDDKVQSWSMAPAEAGHADALFFNNEAALVSKLRKSKKLLVEVVFFDQGTYQFHFDTEGLAWQ